jgi:thiosulfate dehydrogenase
MKLNKINTSVGYVVAGLIVSVAFLGLFASNSAMAREPYDKAELADMQKQLLEAVNQGYELWHGSKDSMSTNGLACGNCHPDAAATNPQTFPKFQADLGKVAPMRDMINWCITVVQGGQALDAESPEMVAMEAYAFNMHRGQKIDPGLQTRQTPPDVVKGGRGYPWKGSGVGYDKGSKEYPVPGPNQK